MNLDHYLSSKLAKHILLAMCAGILTGLFLKMLPLNLHAQEIIIEGFLDTLGKIFITILTMLVVPIVFISLVCGVCHLGDKAQLGQMAWRTLLLYLCTTAIAITLGISFASLLGIGHGQDILPPTSHVFNPGAAPSFKQTVLNLFPANPLAAMVKGEMIQIIIFALLLGIAIAFAGASGKRVARFFEDLNVVVMKLITMVMVIAPIGVFCLLAAMFANLGIALIFQLGQYFLTVILVLVIHVILTNSLLLLGLARLNPITFFKKMFEAMIFAFSTSSSNASIPVTLATVENKLGVDNSIAAFVVPLGATINMDGTSIMQGIATVFIAQLYGIDIGLTGYLLVIITATLASIGTAGVPSVGLITLTMVLSQVGLPTGAIALIIGVDRLLDMLRTAVNITGDAAVSCVVAKRLAKIDMKVFKQ